MVGIGAYPQYALDCPVNDATDMAAALESISFRAALLLDADISHFRAYVDSFLNDVQKGDETYSTLRVMALRRPSPLAASRFTPTGC